MIRWTVQPGDPRFLREFLREKGISRRIVGRVKFHGGKMWVNQQRVKVSHLIEPGDEIVMELAPEPANDLLLTSHTPLDILYEDDWFLIVNKPSHLVSVPSIAHYEETMASRVKGHLLRNNCPYQVVHTVTRLDRFTSGAMLFAKHMLAHSVMDEYLRSGRLHKEYLALAHGQVAPSHDVIDAPIARSEESIIERCVRADGKPAVTEYWVLQTYDYPASLLKLHLHTGRTHQIRVHLSHRGHPLLGDDLYGGQKSLIDRQALHCQRLSFVHPVTSEMLDVSAPLPNDMSGAIRLLEGSQLDNGVITCLDD